MNQLDKQTEFLRITIEHEYFNNVVPVDLYLEDPSIEKKYGIRIRRDKNSWVLYGRELQKEDFMAEFKKVNLKLNSIVEKPADKRKRLEEERKKEQKWREAEELEKVPVEEQSIPLVVIIKPQSDFYYYVTSFVKESLDKGSVFAQNEIELVEDIILRLGVPSKYFEYIFFMKNKPMNLKIVEVNGLIGFQRVSVNAIKQETTNIIHFISIDPISLSAQYDYHIDLIEDTKYGDRIILNAMKIPEPTSISKENPYQTITTYYTI